MSLQIALVTGASRGIGKAIAQRLAKDGYQVIGTATTEAGATAITDYLKETGGKGIAVNVQDGAAIDQLFSDIERDFGTVQVLVNNAGITQDGLLMRMDDTAWETVIDVNLTAIYRTCKRAVRGMMKARHGRIINVSSVVAQMGNVGQANYAASKAGMEGFSRSLAREIGSRNITVNCVAPGFIETDMTDTLDEKVKASLVENIALGRLGAPDNVAVVVSFLASQEASYITGAVIPVNGGMYM